MEVCLFVQCWWRGPVSDMGSERRKTCCASQRSVHLFFRYSLIEPHIEWLTLYIFLLCYCYWPDEDNTMNKTTMLCNGLLFLMALIGIRSKWKYYYYYTINQSGVSVQYQIGRFTIISRLTRGSLVNLCRSGRKLHAKQIINHTLLSLASYIDGGNRWWPLPFFSLAFGSRQIFLLHFRWWKVGGGNAQNMNTIWKWGFWVPVWDHTWVAGPAKLSGGGVI